SANPALAGGALTWSLEGVPDGAYRLTCGLPGYGPVSEPEVTVAGGVWQTGIEIAMKKADKAVTFALRQDTSIVTGTIRLLTPQKIELNAGDTLAPAASGTYVLDAVADSLAILPLSRVSFFLPGTGKKDTTVSLPLSFS